MTFELGNHEWARGKAGRDDACDRCGHPFDAGDKLLERDDGTIACGMRCAEELSGMGMRCRSCGLLIPSCRAGYAMNARRMRPFGSISADPTTRH